MGNHLLITSTLDQHTIDTIIYCQVPAVLPRARRPARHQPGRGSPGGEARLRPQGGGGAGPGRQQEQPAVPRAGRGPLQQGVDGRMCVNCFKSFV